ncbi:alpha/beta fold hydrolase [Marivita hallyeonensis]|uniref:Pimeloyl-ACP methyl ester carboxylesterase n=1 Tax=Marivita hallyeonensis TaxID=996342 RepID=A0A1M5S450_9RHOB|nr:alpha/beta hydrolase [Marivita hallyeonensis]SHH33402.1 Pimeloyl-ACP methyl ester carboxylesterase [Marivita hallyeonensis]
MYTERASTIFAPTDKAFFDGVIDPARLAADRSPAQRACTRAHEMTTRRAVLTGIGSLALAGTAYATGAFREARTQAESRLFAQSATIDSRAEALEYAVAGNGRPVMMIHGTGGGFDQGLLFAAKLRQRGFSIVAPSRFGYLGSAFPDHASPVHQADALVDLLDHLGIERLPVLGGSAGALTAAEFALRHPDRCSHLGLLVPAANLTNRDPVEFTAMQMLVLEAVFGSDFAFWAVSRLARRQMIRTLLATAPALLDAVSRQEQRRARTILDQIFPISRKTHGMRNDGFWAGTPSPTAYEDIAVPTLILSCEDDLFGTAATARLLAGRIPRADLTVYSSGGHIWLGHDDDFADRIMSFIQPAPT